MAVRVKRHWFADGRPRSVDEQASVLAVTIWKSATNGLQGLRKARFAVEVGDQYLQVLTEFVAFMVTVADRIAYLNPPADETTSPGAWREAFLPALARRLAAIYEENLDQLLAERRGAPALESAPMSVRTAGGHAAALIALLNRRMAEYAEFDYDEGGPEFAFLRYFGACIEEAVVDPADRRWVLDQVMASQAPEAIEYVERGMRGVLGLDPKPRRKVA